MKGYNVTFVKAGKKSSKDLCEAFNKYFSEAKGAEDSKPKDECVVDVEDDA
jgi:hypothetical protein